MYIQYTPTPFFLQNPTSPRTAPLIAAGWFGSYGLSPLTGASPPYPRKCRLRRFCLRRLLRAVALDRGFVPVPPEVQTAEVQFASGNRIQTVTDSYGQNRVLSVLSVSVCFCHTTARLLETCQSGQRKLARSSQMRSPLSSLYLLISVGMVSSVPFSPKTPSLPALMMSKLPLLNLPG